jgi:uncharacterized protein DUF4395
MAKLADAADLKSAGPKGLWGFKSPSRHQSDPSPSALLRVRTSPRGSDARKAAQLARTTLTVQNNRLIADFHEPTHDWLCRPEATMQDVTKRNFILQQGFENPASGSCSTEYSALHFQPRVVLIWLVAGIVFQRPWIFATLCAVLWWSAAFPSLNPFDALYNRTLGNRPGAFHVTPAPAPRRTAQAIAGSLAFASALLIWFEVPVAAYVVEAIFLAAVVALVVGGFCLGSFVYHLCRGHAEFACRTLPWAR